jgi:hypothetical protein
MDTNKIRNRLIAAKAPLAKIDAAITKLSIAKQLDDQAKKEAGEAWQAIYEHLKPCDEDLLDLLEDAPDWVNAKQISQELDSLWAYKTVFNNLRRLVKQGRCATRKERGRLREYASLSRINAGVDPIESPKSNVIWRAV